MPCTAKKFEKDRPELSVNGLKDVIVVNTDDALYVGKRGSSPSIKQIINDNSKLIDYTQNGSRVYRQWGYL